MLTQPDVDVRLHKSAPRQNLLILAAYSLLAFIFTWPLPLTAGSTIMGRGGDGWQEVWEMWWMKRAIGTGAMPYHFSTVYAPFGATNYLHSLNPIEIILTLPVNWLFNPVVAYNVACLAAIALTAFATYLLCRDVTGNSAAAFIAGLAVGFSAHQFAQLLGHLDVASVEFFVICIWSFYRSLKSSGTRALVWGLWSAASLAASALTHPYSLICSVLVLVAMGLYWTIVKRTDTPRWRPLVKSLVTLTTGLLVASPLIIAMATQLSGPNAPERRDITQEEIEFFSADLAAYFVPSPFHPVWGQAAQAGMQSIKGGESDNVVFPGYTLLLLGFIGTFSRSTRRKALFWSMLAALGFILSLGPTLQIGGNNTGVPMPAIAVYALPWADIVRVPARFSILVLLGLAVCAAFGIGVICDILRAKKHSATTRQALTATIALVLILELIPIPYPLSNYETEPWASALLALPDKNGAVLEVPFDRGDTRPLAAQMTHNLPLVGGYLSKQPVDPLSSGVPPFTDLGLNRLSWLRVFDRTRDTLCMPAPDATTYQDLLRLFGVRYVVLHLDRLSPEDPRIAQVAMLAGSPPIFKAQGVELYAIDERVLPTELFGGVEDTEDWSDAEGPAEARYKWSTRNYMRLYFWSSQDREIEVRFQLESFVAKRDITISVDQHTLLNAVVDQTPYPIQLNWNVPKGLSTLLIHTGGQGIKPASVGVGTDIRALTLRLSDCSYKSK